jgi:hypothetical protein
MTASEVASAASDGVLGAPPALEEHFLDTNAYAVLLCGSPPDADARLRARLFRGAYAEAAISELTSLEIHSVLGQLLRGCTGGLHSCDRNIEPVGGISQCSHRWIQRARKPLRSLELERLRKAIRDAESGHGPLRLSVIPLGSADFANARQYLYRHGGSWRFGSHDAVIAAAAERYAGGNVRLVTSDGGLKSLLRAIRQRYYDPQKDEVWNP